jgi:hypothetical protein
MGHSGNNAKRQIEDDKEIKDNCTHPHTEDGGGGGLFYLHCVHVQPK